MEAQQWLEAEDKGCREARLARLDWLAERVPKSNFLTFPGGWLAKRLFEEARYCFVYGQFLAASLLGFAFIERTLAALLYAAGRDDMERAGPSRLISEAYALGWLNEAQRESLDHVRRLRNLTAHFRKPLERGTVEHRSVVEGEDPYVVTAEDASIVMKVAFALVGRNAA